MYLKSWFQKVRERSSLHNIKVEPLLSIYSRMCSRPMKQLLSHHSSNANIPPPHVVCMPETICPTKFHLKYAWACNNASKEQRTSYNKNILYGRLFRSHQKSLTNTAINRIPTRTSNRFESPQNDQVLIFLFEIIVGWPSCWCFPVYSPKNSRYPFEFSADLYHIFQWTQFEHLLWDSSKYIRIYTFTHIHQQQTQGSRMFMDGKISDSPNCNSSS